MQHRNSPSLPENRRSRIGFQDFLRSVWGTSSNDIAMLFKKLFGSGLGSCWAVMNGPLLEWILERDGRGLLELIQVLPLETETLPRTPREYRILSVSQTIVDAIAGSLRRTSLALNPPNTSSSNAGTPRARNPTSGPTLPCALASPATGSEKVYLNAGASIDRERI